MQRGGKREGSGRKRKDNKTINKSVTLPIEVWEKLNETAKNKGFKSVNILAAEIIKKFIDLF